MKYIKRILNYLTEIQKHVDKVQSKQIFRKL